MQPSNKLPVSHCEVRTRLPYEDAASVLLPVDRAMHLVCLNWICVQRQRDRLDHYNKTLTNKKIQVRKS